jgi:5-methyltetrahydrofolate--homocysteine methyltransferase
MDFKILTEYIKRPIIFDGGFGALLIKRGFRSPPVTYNLTNPDVVKEIHCEYLFAGADILTANTFGAHSARYGDYEKLIASALSIAKEAVAENGRNNVYIALSLAPTGLQTPPMGSATFEELYHIFKKLRNSGRKKRRGFCPA